MWEKYKHIVSHIAAGSGVIGTIAGWAGSSGYRNILVVCDPVTYKIAGENVVSSLKNAAIETRLFCFDEDEPLPDERSAGQLLAAYTPGTDLILGVGSGTINDICTYVGSRIGCPSAIAGTAPSMDGYASLGSAMLFGGLKVTPPTQCPAAIFCDTDILKDAPMEMIASGLGDMLGKITSLADWRLSHILTGEPVPGEIYGIMKDALDKIMTAAPLASKRDPGAIESITGGLVLSGIAMSLYGDSRPASGTEHHLAHFWEMRALANGHKPAPHGLKVALAAAVALGLWQKLAAQLSAGDMPQRSASAVSGGQRESEIRRLYGPSADAVLQTVNPDIPAAHILKHRQEILDIAGSLPPPGEIINIMMSAGFDMRPKSIGLGSSTLRESIIYARERKKTYTLLQLLGDLSLLGDYAEYAEEFFSESALKNVKCCILDMDGTIYLGSRLFPYTPGFLKHLEKKGIDYYFFTNNSSQNAAHYIQKLRSMDINIPESKLLMSTHVLLDYLNENHRQKFAAPPAAFIAGTQALKDDFIKAGYTLTDKGPDFVVLGFDTDMNYGTLAKLCDFVRAGLPYYGVNMDYNCPVDGGFIPDCGSLAAAVCASTGIMPEFFGKPSRRALDYICMKTGYRENEICFIGDRLYTDIAITTGTKACSILVLSGEAKREDVQQSTHIPDLIVDNIGVLTGLF